ncbi:MAG: hypothetical protein R3F31_22135 [Verrucomicrobiales bacterium]
MSIEIEVEAQPDHLDSPANAKPVNALAELLWNSFDADASVVEVDVEENGLGGVEEIVVRTTGLASHLTKLTSASESLEAHGRRGRAELRARSECSTEKKAKAGSRPLLWGDELLGKQYLERMARRQPILSQGSHKLKKFSITDPSPSPGAPTGTIVRIRETPMISETSVLMARLPTS